MRKKRMANDIGYILTAMDWWGMSSFDFPVVIKTLLGIPNTFESVRDNLLQGYADKLMMQRFSRDGIVDWLEEIGGTKVVPTADGDGRPASVFYGISQGASWAEVNRTKPLANHQKLV